MVRPCTNDAFLCHSGRMVSEGTPATDEPVRVVVVDDQELFRRGLTMLLGVELTAYRIVQESLTNVLKHSTATHADVAVTYQDSGVDIEVRDDGTGERVRVGDHSDSAGHGLLGLRERTRLLGGDLDYGPLGVGFRVSAHLPFSSVEPS